KACRSSVCGHSREYGPAEYLRRRPAAAPENLPVRQYVFAAIGHGSSGISVREKRARRWEGSSRCCTPAGRGAWIGSAYCRLEQYAPVFNLQWLAAIVFAGEDSDSMLIRKALRSEYLNLWPLMSALWSMERYSTKPSFFCASKYLTFFSTTPVPSTPGSRLSFMCAILPPAREASTISPWFLISMGASAALSSPHSSP